MVRHILSGSSMHDERCIAEMSWDWLVCWELDVCEALEKLPRDLPICRHKLVEHRCDGFDMGATGAPSIFLIPLHHVGHISRTLGLTFQHTPGHRGPIGVLVLGKLDDCILDFQ